MLLAAHLCHSRVLWTEEDLPLAAARQIIFGKSLYRNIWFDKPPLIPLVYLLWSARIGVVLRVAGAIYCLFVSWLAYAVSRALWGFREAFWAAILMSFFLTFDTPSAVLPLAADSLLLAPHLLAILLAIQRRPLSSGVVSGIGFFFNNKAAFVLISSLLFAGAGTPILLAGFALVCALAVGVLTMSGQWQPYLDQVWIWSSAYAKNTFVDRPVFNGFLRTANWSGFHLAILLPMGWALASLEEDRRRKLQLAAWALISFAGVALGWRFFPRYYFLFLPVMVVAASRGITLLGKRSWLVLILLLIPLIRFGPRYVLLAANLDPQWSDLAMNRESYVAAQLVNRLKEPGDTLFVWGYRPDLFAYTGLPSGTNYVDCQAMTGVPADRHLTQWTSILPAETTAIARRQLAASYPTFVVDGLSEYNPHLAITIYPELKPWIAQYKIVEQVPGILVYRLK